MANYYVIGLCTIIGLTIFGLLYDSFDMDIYQCGQVRQPVELDTEDTTREFTSKNITFDMYGKRTKDVMVLMHIQKTGGSAFGRHLKADLVLERPCLCQRKVKKCDCSRPGNDNEMWFFSEFSVGWACGVHADWTEMINCVPAMLDKFEKVQQRRRYFYVTMLREPFARFLSEWKHVQRGATWHGSLHMCDGKLPTADELAPCYKEPSWAGVSLAEFLACPSNLAINRQTRMLADLSEVGCYSKLFDAEHRAKMLESAKRNLKHFAFFGLTEYQIDTQMLFEDSFKLTFRKDFVQLNDTHASQIEEELTEDQIRVIREANAEDFLLYDYAKELFLQRIAILKSRRKRKMAT